MPPDEDIVEAGSAKSRKLTIILVIGALMLAEGGLIFGAMKFFGGAPGPASASTAPADQATSSQKGAAPQIAEVLIAELDAYNNLSGRLYLYHLQVSAQVKPEAKTKIEKIIEQRGDTICDRINTVIRGADPKHLNEPGLETMRRQIKFELDKILGDDSLVLELLIPKLLQSRANL